MSEKPTASFVTQVSVDLQFKDAKPPLLQCMQYDTNLRLLEIRLLKDGIDWPVPEGWAVNVRMKKSDGTSIYQGAAYEGSRVYLVLTGQMCCVAGEHPFLLEIVGEEEVIQTPILLLKVWKNPISSKEFTSQSDYQILRDMVEEADQARKEAQASAQSAAENAAEAATNARESQENADQAYTWNQNCQTLYHSVDAMQQQVNQQYQELLQVNINHNFQVLSQEEYNALTPPNPKRLYLAESSHPNNHLAAYFPLQGDFANQLDPTMDTAVAVGGEGFSDWDGTGISYRSFPAAGQPMDLEDLVALSTNTGLELYSNGYIMPPRPSGVSQEFAVVNLRSPCPFEAGATYLFEMTSCNPTNQVAVTNYGNAGHLALAKADGTVLDLGTAITSTGTGAQGSITFTAPSDIGDYTQLYFYYDNPSYYQNITLSITRSPSPTIRQNYLALPGGLFAGRDFSQGISFALDIKPDALGDWTRIFQFYAPAEEGQGEGDLYATQGVTATGYWEESLVQQMGYGNYQCITPGVWHTFVFTVSPSQLYIYLDGSLKTTASDTGSTLSALLSHLDCFTQNYLGYSRFEDADYAGLLRNFRIYHKALSSAEVSQIHAAPSARLYWGELLLADSQEGA